ncbi:MAG TPA: hypothetical protein VIE89_08185 [Candidatus Binatia bacterium]|jgi:hypothetical protein
MRPVAWLVLLAALTASQAGFTATKDSQPPDKEMLRMLDFLRDMEMIKQAEMMQDLSQVEQVEDPNSEARSGKTLTSKRKAAVK